MESKLREGSWPKFKVNFRQFNVRMKENHENLSQDIGYPGLYLNTRPPKYRTRVVTTRKRRSVKLRIIFTYIDQ